MIRFEVDTSEIDAMSRSLALMIGQYDWITARAMTNAAKAAKAKLSQTVYPQIQGGPNPWTRRGLMVSFASPGNLVSNVGWNYGDGSFTAAGAGSLRGTPSGTYMGLLARGGDRAAKPFERRLRMAGVIKSGQFVAPFSRQSSGGLRLDQYGNTPAAEYVRILSRLKAELAGSTSAARGPGSRGRTAAKRRQSDYFMMYDRDLSGGGARFIAKRKGRGFVPVMSVMESPNYEKKFDIQGIALREYRTVFPGEFKRALERELARSPRR